MKKKKPGFTLVEMIIVVALTTMVLGIVNAIFSTGNKVFSDSDVKSTLQIEGQAVQEKISNIAMQGTGVISSVPPNITNGEITNIIIKSYVNGANSPKYFNIKRNGRNLSIDTCTDPLCQNIENSQNISDSINSFGINYNIQNETIEFNIGLNSKKGYSDVNHPINFTIMFRNKGK